MPKVGIPSFISWIKGFFIPEFSRFFAAFSKWPTPGKIIQSALFKSEELFAKYEVEFKDLIAEDNEAIFPVP